METQENEAKGKTCVCENRLLACSQVAARPPAFLREYAMPVIRRVRPVASERGRRKTSGAPRRLRADSIASGRGRPLTVVQSTSHSLRRRPRQSLISLRQRTRRKRLRARDGELWPSSFAEAVPKSSDTQNILKRLYRWALVRRFDRVAETHPRSRELDSSLRERDI